MKGKPNEPEIKPGKKEPVTPLPPEIKPEPDKNRPEPVRPEITPNPQPEVKPLKGLYFHLYEVFTKTQP